MVVESWITPEETPALAAAATAIIDAHLARLKPADRAAYWASIVKAYNTPYNPPAKAAKPVAVAPATPVAITIELGDAPPIAAVIAQGSLAADAHAA